MITFGGYNLDEFAPNQTLSWNSLIDTDYWSLRLTKVSLNGVIIPITTNKAIIDSGTSFTVMPTTEF